MDVRSNLPRLLELKRYELTRRRYILLEGGSQVGHLRFLKVFGSLAEAESKGKSFTFERVGFLKPMVTIRKANLEEVIGYVRFERKWGFKCILEMLNGGTSQMRSPTLRDRNWSFYQSDGDLMVFRYKEKLFSAGGTCTIFKEPAWIDPILLSLIGWYIILIAMER